RDVFFFQAEDGIRDGHVTGVQTCALPIYINALLQRVDVDALIERTELGSLVARSGTAVIGHVIDAGRSGGIALDTAVNRFVDRRSEERRVGKECRYGGCADG